MLIYDLVILRFEKNARMSTSTRRLYLNDTKPTIENRSWCGFILLEMFMMNLESRNIAALTSDIMLRTKDQNEADGVIKRVLATN